MRSGARTPEELESLFEDAFVTRDSDAITWLFEDGAVLISDGLAVRARGDDEIARAATAMWEREMTYVADPRRVVQARDTALVLAQGGVNVVRRGTDRAWRYAISLMELNPTEESRDVRQD